MTGSVSGHAFRRAEPLRERIGFSAVKGTSEFVMSPSPAETAMRFVPGGFVYRLRKECGNQGELWRRGFS